MRPLFSVEESGSLLPHRATPIAVNRSSVKISNKQQLILGPQRIGQHKVCE